VIAPTLNCACDNQHRSLAWSYDAPPQGETPFNLNGAAYRRAYERCDCCGHLFGKHQIDLSSLYRSDYVDATYGGIDGMRRRFERVMSLPPEKSDNRSRVSRFLAFAQTRGLSPTLTPRLLDVGAGLGVFPAAMRSAGWHVVGLEPDPRTVEHLRTVAGVEALADDLLGLDPESIAPFDAVSFNKVLEHVEDPVALLRPAATFLNPNGFVYVEVPDVAATREGPDREEFCIEHHHVFSPASVAILAQRSGFDVRVIERLREPSTKYTLRAFLVPCERASTSAASE
jgi:SAM-dependent methyltransferase